MTTVMTEYGRRPKRAWQADGLLDMAIGSVILCIALICLDAIYMLSFIATQKGGSANYVHVSYLNMVVTSVIQLSVVVPFALIEPLKRRFVYPRTGYMQMRVNPKGRRLSFVISLAIGIAIAVYSFVLIGKAGSPDPTGLSGIWTAGMSAIACGTGFGIALVVNYLKFGFARHLVIAAVSIATSFLVATTHLDWEHQFLILEIVVGGSMLIAGVVPFVQLLRTPLLDVQMEQEAE